ncbi:Protein RTA1 [Lachnellula cervina]|uniref:Protein RTA1 n=1 Tax=Lachnellula cervina TaxID=1316786 RepID=A0A7D8YRH2_9HELO|nr:Protein RTA1 [Lachnellula cervina]
MAVLEAYKGVYCLWKYIPSLTASIIFMILFLLITCLHMWRICKYRTWFCTYFALGCFCEVIGYASRAAAYNNTASIPFYILQAAFLVAAPAFYTASLYMTLSRTIRALHATHLSPIRASRLTKIFVVGDMLSLNIQGGASSLASHPKTAQVGSDLVVAGLIIQLLLLGVFFVTGVVFQVRFTRESRGESLVPWRKTLGMVYGVCWLIFARSVFRVVEYVQGADGSCLRHEWTLYVFDAAPMLVVSVLFWVPGFVVEAVERGEEGVELNGRNKDGDSR